MYIPKGDHVTLTLPPTAVTIGRPTAAADCEGVLMQVTGANAKFYINGATPTAASGFTLYNGADPVYCPVIGDNIVVIRAAAGAILDYQWC